MFSLISYSLFLYILCNYYILSSALQCIDENNDPVDWFTVYKIPKLKHENKLIEEGFGYFYVTSKNYDHWLLSQYSINKSDSIIGQTLKPLYSIKNNTYVLYNDQPPNQPTKESKGHTKGVIIADSDGGFWLIHSVPHFPLGTKYEFPHSGTLKGQSFLCISLDLENLNKVGIQLQYNEPQIFDSNILEITKTKLSHIVEAVSGVVISEPPWYNSMSITSKNGTNFLSFAKSKQFGKDLYHDWIAPALQTDLFTETWLNGAGRLPSNCTQGFKVYNINTVSMTGVNVTFASSEDHSKWATSVHDPWVCIGDINRMNHQKFRGGGSVCLNNQQLTEKYRNTVAALEKCHSNIF